MSHYLLTNQTLGAGEYLSAPNGSCFAIMQRDGNFCIYLGRSPAEQRGFVWGALQQSQPDGDYFAIMQDDGNFVVYQGVPGKAGRYVWGTQTVAPGGKFILAVENGAILTLARGVPEDPEHQAVLWASRKLRVLTYNTHLIEGSNVEVGAKLKNELPVVFRDEERHQFIVKKIKESGADVVALEEVWSAKRMDQIRADLKPEYQHSIRGTNGPDTKAGSGIVLVSKFPLINWDFKEYASTDQEESEDSWASKGALYATVDLQDGGAKLRVGMTHAWTNAGSKGRESPNISDMTNWTLQQDGDQPAVLMGDFNVHRMSDRTKYESMDGFLKGKGASDAWTRVHGSGADAASATDDQANNTLDQFFSPARNTPDADCIDYIYLRNGKTRALRPISAEVLRDWKYPTGSSNPRWYWVHQGTTSRMPSAAIFGEKLCVVVRTNEGNMLALVFDQATRKWTDRYVQNNNVNVTTDGAPGIAWFANRLHLFFQQGRQVYKMESDDGFTWTNKDSQGQDFRSSGGVCPVLYRGTLFVFCRDPHGDGNQICYHEWGGRWSERKWAGLCTRHDISAAVIGETLCLVAIEPGSGSTSGVMHVRLDGSNIWTRPAQLAPHVVCSGAPGISARNGKFEVFYREKDGGGIFCCTSTDGTGKAWQSPDFTGHATTDQVCPVAVKDRTLFFYPYVVNAGDHLCYPQRAVAHGLYPTGVDLDASDHYPYQVDLVWPS